MIKQLNINNNIYAKYCLENETLHLSVSRVNKLLNTQTENEIQIIRLIQQLEKVKVKTVNYSLFNDF